jgi:transposase
MISTTHHAESSAPALYVALELSTKEWWLTMSISPQARARRRRIAVGDQVALAQAIASGKAAFQVPEHAPVRTCYEAGRDGFWPHRLLTTCGIVNLVVDSSSIEVTRRAKQAKTDRLDGGKLLRLLMRHWGGERDMWQVVRVPRPEIEDERHASRTRTTLQIERTRYRNRIHALLMLHGARLPIDRALPERLPHARDWAGHQLPAGVRTRILAMWTLLAAVEAARAQARRAETQAIKTAAAGTCARGLTQLRGVGARSATVLAAELFTRDLRNRREVGGLTGLVSAPHQSGQRRVDQGLTRGGLPRIRHIAGQLAWAWLRYQPASALARWYRERFGGRGVIAQRIGIVALARRLVIALWRYVTVGIVPDGALLKAA